MPKDISYRAFYLDGGVAVPLAAHDVYLRPTRTDIHVKIGSTWYPWEASPLVSQSRYGAAVVANTGSGVATFQAVPFTDTEVQLPLDPSGGPVGAPCEWQIIDPMAGAGAFAVRTFTGPLPSSLGTDPTDTKALVSLTSPEVPWRITNFMGSGEPASQALICGSIDFGPGVQEATISLFPLPALPLAVFFGQSTDSYGNTYGVGVQRDGSGTLLWTQSSIPLRLSAPAQSTVTVWFGVQP